MTQKLKTGMILRTKSLDYFHSEYSAKQAAEINFISESASRKNIKAFAHKICVITDLIGNDYIELFNKSCNSTYHFIIPRTLIDKVSVNSPEWIYMGLWKTKAKGNDNFIYYSPYSNFIIETSTELKRSTKEYEKVTMVFKNKADRPYFPGTSLEFGEFLNKVKSLNMIFGSQSPLYGTDMLNKGSFNGDPLLFEDYIAKSNKEKK